METLGTEERINVDQAMNLKNKIRSKTAKVGVIGMGYVGLPLAVEMAAAGFDVTGIDNNDEIVAELSEKHSHIPDVVSERLAPYVDAGSTRFTTDTSVMAGLDVLCICVPTPLDEMKAPDLAAVLAVTEEVAKYLRPGQLVVLESTTYPGTTEEELLPILEKGGLSAGEDFFLAFSPERVDPGNTKFQTKNTPKVVGGVTRACTECAAALYGEIIETPPDVKNVVPVSNARTAEMTKLLENIFRGVNIALVNELLLLCGRMNIDMWEVVEAAATKPFGFYPFYPGPGPGGHCIPIDPFYLSWKARQHEFRVEFIELSGRMNEFMPYHVRERVVEALNMDEKSINGATILVLGVAYKKDVNDPRESPAKRVIELLRERGGNIHYHDPHVPLFEIDGCTMESEPYDDEAVEKADCVVVVTDHSAIDYEDLEARARRIVDCRHAVPESAKVVRI